MAGVGGRWRIDAGQRVDIDGDNVFATLFEVDTLPPEACKLECHQNYADIQYLLSGMEGAGYALPTQSSTH